MYLHVHTAFYLRASFGTNVGSAVIESPVYNVSTPVCLSFFYQVSSPTITLSVLERRESNFVVVTSFTFDETKPYNSWSKAVISMTHGVEQFRLTADKIGITNSSQFVIVDRITLRSISTCTTSGKHIRILKES